MKMKTHHTACPLCGREKEAGRTTFTVHRGFGVVVVREVPAISPGCSLNFPGDTIRLRKQEYRKKL